MELSDKTRAELEAMTKKELIAGILEGQTFSDVSLVKDEDGNNVELTETTYESLTGYQVGTRIVRWIYYPGGEVDEITVDEGNKRMVVKHSLDGTQPVVTSYLVAEETFGDRVFAAAVGGAGGAASGIRGVLSRILGRA